MSETTEVRNALGLEPSDSSANQKSSNEPKDEPKEPLTKQENPAPARRSPFAFAMFKKTPKVHASADRTQMLGELLDAARKWVEEQAADVVARWRDAAGMDRESHSYGLMEEQAHLVVKDVASFLSGKESFGDEPSDGPWSDDEKARVMRSSAIYYAAKIWGDKNAPDDEVWRALWFLLGTDAARVTQSEPHGAESIKIFHLFWLEFPHAFLGAPTSDGRAIEKSGLLGVSKNAVNLIRKDGSNRWKHAGEARRRATIHSLPEFYKAPREGVLVIPVRAAYLREPEKLLGGGLLVVEITGAEREDLRARVVEVVNNTIFATFEYASRMKGVPLHIKFSVLSGGFSDILTDGVELKSLALPFSVLEMKNLNESRIDLGYREEPNKFVALCRIARTLRRAIGMELRVPPKAKPVLEEKGTAGRSEEKKTAAEPQDTRGEKIAAHKAGEKVKREATEDLKAALVSANVKYRLPVLKEPAEFFSRKLPRGATLASFPPVFYFDGKSVKDVSCVLVRRVAKGKEEVCAFPPHLALLFNGKYDRLILAKLAVYARWLSKEKQGSKQVSQVSGEEGTRVPEQHAVEEKIPQAGGAETIAPLHMQAETASEPSSPPVLAEEGAPHASEEVDGADEGGEEVEARGIKARFTPAAAKIAAELGITQGVIRNARRSGKGGSITKEDVLDYNATRSEK